MLLLQVLVQAGLAGGFVSGSVTLLGLHTANAIIIFPTSLALIAACVLLLRPGRGPWWPVVFSAVLWLLIVAQTGFGFARLIGLHIPLGVTVFGLTTVFAWWSFRYRPAVAGTSAPETTVAEATA